MTDPREFTCQDCGALVFSFGGYEGKVFGQQPANDQSICAECSWLRAIEDPEEREKLRKFLQERR